MSGATYKEALEAFVSTINNTGGVIEFSDGTYAPVGDEDWIDLGDAYIKACFVLGIRPEVSNSDEYPESDL